MKLPVLLKNRPYQRLVAATAAGLLAAVVMFGAPTPDISSIVIFKPVESFDRGQPMTFTAKGGEKLEWITFFFRFSATVEFEARMMKADQAGGYSTTLSADELTVDHLEYYLAYKTQAQIRYLPEDVPAHFFSTRASSKSETALPAIVSVKPQESSISLGFDGSGSQVLSEDNGSSAASGFQQSENFRLAFQTGHESLQVIFDARLQYNNSSLGCQKKFSFGDGLMRVSLGQHYSLQAGGIILNGTEMSLQSLGRRGLAFGWASSRMNLEIFTLATQQLPGFEGMIAPKSGASLFGSILAFSFLENAVTIQATGLTGKDDPALGINTGFTSAFKSREGDLFSLSGKANLWRNSLAFDFELARSHCDPDTTDTQPAINDNAWRVGGKYSRGILDLHASLKNIGKDFNSIGQQFLVNDRRILDTGIGLHVARFNISTTYLTQHDNVNSNSAISTAKETELNTAFGWDFSRASSLQLGYSHSNNDLPTTILSPIGCGVKKDGYFGTLICRSGQSTSLQLMAQRDEFSSATKPELDGHSLTLNFGGNFWKPQQWSLGYQLGMTSARYTATKKDGRFYYAFVNGDLAVLGRLLSLSLIAGYNRNEPGVGDTQKMSSLDGGLVLRTPPDWKIGMIMISLRGQWIKNETPDSQNDSYRIYLKCDFSLGGT